MRTITLLVIHCSAVRPDQTSSAAQIDTWHRRDSYHYVVRRDGQIEPGRPEWMVGAHCLHHNSYSIGICYEGGLDIRGQPADTRTEAQKAAMLWLLRQLRKALSGIGISIPAAIVRASMLSNMLTCSLNKQAPPSGGACCQHRGGRWGVNYT